MQSIVLNFDDLFYTTECLIRSRETVIQKNPFVGFEKETMTKLSFVHNMFEENFFPTEGCLFQISECKFGRKNCII